MPIESLDASTLTAKPISESFETLDGLPEGVKPLMAKEANNAPQTMAPAKGAFPAVDSSGLATVPRDTFEPQSPTPVHAPAPSQAPAAPVGVLEEMGNDAIKGGYNIKNGLITSRWLLGLGGDVNEVADHLASGKDLEARYPSSPETKAAAEELKRRNYTGFAGVLPSLGYYATEPRLSVSAVMGSVASMVPTAIGGAAGALAGSVIAPGAGTVAGALAGVGVGSAAADHGAAFKEYIEDKYKPQNKLDWLKILNDPEKVSEANTYAVKHAGVVGAADALGGGLGGRVGMAVGNKVGGGAVKKVLAGTVPALATDATVGAAGEAGGQMLGHGEWEPRDASAVAGEFVGGFLMGGAGSAVQPTVRALGLDRQVGNTAPTPADIAGATDALQVPPAQPVPEGVVRVPVTKPEEVLPPAPTPEQVSGSIISGDATPMFYSPARRYIEEKGPGAADAGQWAATLRNAPGVKQEELNDLGLDTLFAESGGKLTKKEVLDHLDERAIRVEETQRDNEGMRRTLTGFVRTRDATYEDYTLPGERQGYTELTLHMPTRNVEGDNQQRDFVGGHYSEPNVVVHARVTDRVDRNGAPFALIEEIQSDWHQRGRKGGYDDVAARLAVEEKLNAAGWPVSGQDARDAVEAGILTREEADRLGSASYTPTGPFKQSWDELAFKRMLRWAADKGYRRVAWVNAAEQSRRYPGDAKRDAGMVQFYDKGIPSIAKKWAKRLGGVMGEMSTDGQFSYDVLDVNGEVYDRTTNKGIAEGTAARIGGTVRPEQLETTVQYIDLPQAGLEMVQRGLPMYSAIESRKTGVTLDELAGPAVQNFAAEFTPALDELVKRFKLGEVTLHIHQGAVVIKGKNGRNRTVANALGMASIYPGQNGKSEIHVSLRLHRTAAEVWATITHEMGHIILERHYANAPTNTKIAIRAAYEEFLANSPHNENMQRLVARRDNAVVAYHNTRQMSPTSTRDQQGSPQQRQYWVSFEEWFAEQTAKWATTDIVPLSTVEKFFRGLGHKIVDALEAARAKFGLPFTPAKAMSDWLNSFHTDAAPFAEDINTQVNVETTKENAPHMAPEDKPVERQPETVAAREGLDALFNGRPPKEVKQAAAYADKFNKMYKWALGIHQVAQRNPGIQPLQEYVEIIAVAEMTKKEIQIAAQTVVKAWNKLGQRGSDALSAFIDDVENMVYRTDDEVKAGTNRYPTQPEVAALAKKHGVTAEGLSVFKMIAESFSNHLTRLEAMMNKEANAITDPKTKAEAIAANATYIANLRSKPYFPAMRFGDFTVTVRDTNGKVIHFETFEKERRQRLAAEAIQTKYGVSRDQIQLAKMDPTVRPLLGVPAPLLERMAEKLNLNAKQRDALEQLKFDVAPAQSFKHHFQHKQRIAGYSMDFRRAYANYFFHGANHLVKAMYADDLRGLIKATKDQVKNQYDTNTRSEIVTYMNDHLDNYLDPKPDWHAVRAIAFMWSLAFVPAAATANLTQTLMTTFPFLAHQFGDVQAMATMLKVLADNQTYYKTGKLTNHTDFELRAAGRAVADGTLDDQMAAELAGFAEGRTLGLGMGGNEVQRGLTWFQEKGAYMFQMAEKLNRRLAFRAALKLTLANPGSKYAKAMVLKHKLKYDQLRKEGWTEAQAQAYVAAVDATDETQFKYAKEYRPRMMRGRKSSVLVFKTFIQSYLVFLANYPAAATRSILIMGFLGGLMGIPGAEDLKEILKALGWQLFGKDFDLEKEARRYVIQLLGDDENGRQWADTVMQGTARQGFGIPGMMDMLGGTVGVDVSLPRFDRSAAISAGTILPIELGKIFGPPVISQDKAIADTVQKASGAVFGAGFNVYKALANSKTSATDFKRWEKAVPRALGAVSKSYRVGTEGQERTSTGSMLVKYDVRDTEQLMEVIGMAAGYTPYRQNLQWDRIMAGQEAVKLWDFRRTGLMKQMGNAVLGKDPKEIERVKGAIKSFNESLPHEARGKAITSDTLTKSIQTQARTRQAQEAESSVKKSDIPILQEVQKLYPESRATSVRRVRGTP